jgi:hypothetical protein
MVRAMRRSSCHTGADVRIFGRCRFWIRLFPRVARERNMEHIILASVGIVQNYYLSLAGR